METALLAQKLGRYPIVVIDRYRELDLLLQVSRRLGIRPHIGVRTKLTTRAPASGWNPPATAPSSGSPPPRWSPGGPAAGDADARLLGAGALPHRLADLGGARHQGRYEGGLPRLRGAGPGGCGLQFIDVGGGLGVDYDGSQTNWQSSTNYTCRSTPTTSSPRSSRPATSTACRIRTSSASRGARSSPTTRCWSSTCWT